MGVEHRPADPARGLLVLVEGVLGAIALERVDPRNALYLRAGRAVEVLRLAVALLENVPAVQHDAGRVVGRATRTLEAAGYTVSAAVVNLSGLGVPQRRRRHLLLATRDQQVDPDNAAEALDVTLGCVERLPGRSCPVS
ncbi:MAG: DNA cytosine methyltransferase [Egibacteraceae bacterium]